MIESLDRIVDRCLRMSDSGSGDGFGVVLQEAPLFARAQRALRHKDTHRARQHIEELRRHYPHSPLTGVALADFFLATNALGKAFRAYSLLIAHEPAFFYPRRQQLRCCYQAEEAAQGLAAYQQAASVETWSQEQRIALAHIGAALYALSHQFEPALDLCRMQVQHLLTRPLPRPEKRELSSFAPDAAWRTLSKVNCRLRAGGLAPFPTAGTLLGWQREGQLLPFDKDVDMALPPGAELEKVRQLLLGEGSLHLVRPDMGYSSYFSVLDGESGCTCDILLHRLQGGKVQHGWFLPDRPHGDGRLLLFTPYRLVEEEWRRERFYRPDNSDLYLRELYGDWRTPDPLFDGVVGPRNLVGLSVLTLSYAYNNLLAHLQKGRRDKAHSLVLCLQEKGVVDPLLAEVMTALQEKGC